MDSILVVGAGAVGSFVAASLGRAGLNPLLVARGPRLDDARMNGILLDRDGTVTRTPIRVIAWDELQKGFDLVVLCTKTIDLTDALDRLVTSVKTGTVFLTLQNGVEAPYEVVQRFPRHIVLGGRLHGFFDMDGELVRHVGVEPSICFGRMSGLGNYAEEELGAVLSRAGIGFRISNNILRDLWEKFLLAAALGGASASLGVAAGQILRDIRGSALLHSAMNEIMTLAAARGIALPPDCVERTLEFVAGFPASATTSLQRDLEAGRGSEYSALIGAVLRMGTNAGLELPTFNHIDAMIRSRLEWLA